MTSDEPVRELEALYAGAPAHALYDESVTELEHALQAAALAADVGADDALVAAALLHDLGHLIAGDLRPINEALTTDARHEHVGARHLRRAFGPEVTAPIALHVAAKRYLVAVEPDYVAILSASSVRSLAVQGGAMTPAEVEVFCTKFGWARAVDIRRWDDAAKVAGTPTPDFAHFTPLLRGLLKADAG